MVVMVNGKVGAIVLSHVEADSELGAGNVITQLHNMVEKIARISDPQPKRWNATLITALVSVFVHLLYHSFGLNNRVLSLNTFHLERHACIADD